ncbi:MAG: insulinase family protein [Alphaproteobacteria bacterium]|nr:insulinase family protein [Alphaproteobacteria bacterium]
MRCTLGSGARLVLDPVPGSAVTAVYLWVRSGSCDELEGQHGAAHFVEHMLFKGTERHGVGEIATAIEAVGGDINAYTTYDQTVFHATVPTPSWQGALDVLVDMALHSRFDPQEIELERQVILDEIRSGRDDPARCLGEAVAARAFQRHPFGRPVIGTTRSVGGMAPEALRAFYERVYHPENLIVSVSGDVDADALIALCERLLPPRPPVGPAPVRPVEPPQTRARSIIVPGRFEEPMLELAFRGVPHDHPDAAALDLLITALGEGSASVLGAALQLGEGLVTSTWGVCETEHDDGLVLLGCTPLGGRTLQAARALAAQVDRARAHGVPLAQLHRARTQILSLRLFTAETVDGRAHENAWYEAFFGDPAAAQRYRAALEAVTAADVRRVAAQYLRPERCTLGALLPEAEAEPAAVRQAASLSRRPALPKARPAVHRRVLDSGLTLLVEPLEHTQVAAIRAVGLGGQLVERAGSAGLCELWSRTAGAWDLSARELAEYLDDRGATLSGLAGRNTLGVELDLPAGRIDDAVDLVGAVLCAPRFDQGEAERVLAELREDERLLRDQPSTVADHEAARLLYGAHPYGLPARGTADSLQRLDVPALRRLHRGLITADNLVVAVAGAVDPDAVMHRLERALAGLPPGPARLRRRPRARFSPKRLRAQLAADREQAHIVLAWPGARFSDPDAEALAQAAQVLGGQGGRLFMALRDRRGLAYDVSAESDDGWDRGAFEVRMSMDPEQVAQGVAGLREEVERLAAEGPTAEELERVKQVTLGALAMYRQRSAGRALELALWERYGRDARFARERAAARTLAVTADDVRRALSARLAACGGVEVVVGPESTR